MILARVVGRVWATRKDCRLGQHKLLLVRPQGGQGLPHEGDHLVAIDELDAAVGDEVVICLGSPARWSVGAANLPIDAAVMAVVDGLAFAGANP